MRSLAACCFAGLVLTVDFVLDGRPRKGDDSWKKLNDLYVERFGPAAFLGKRRQRYQRAS